LPASLDAGAGVGALLPAVACSTGVTGALAARAGRFVVAGVLRACGVALACLAGGGTGLALLGAATVAPGVDVELLVAPVLELPQPAITNASSTPATDRGP
jgi:hypothetical protein